MHDILLVEIRHGVKQLANVMSRLCIFQVTPTRTEIFKKITACAKLKDEKQLLRYKELVGKTAYARVH